MCSCFCDLNLFKEICFFLGSLGNVTLIIQAPHDGNNCTTKRNQGAWILLTLISASYGAVWPLRGGQSDKYTAPMLYSRVPCTGCVTVDRPSDLAEPPISKLGWG